MKDKLITLKNKLTKLLISKEFLKFFSVGLISFLLDFFILSFLIYIINLDVTFAKLFNTDEKIGTVLCNLISATISIIFNFILQKNWSFKNKETNVASQLSKFVSTHIFNLIVFNTLFFGALVQMHVLPPIAKIIITAFQMCWSFFAYKFFVFKTKDNGEEASLKKVIDTGKY